MSLSSAAASAVSALSCGEVDAGDVYSPLPLHLNGVDSQKSSSGSDSQHSGRGLGETPRTDAEVRRLSEENILLAMKSEGSRFVSEDLTIIAYKINMLL